MSDDLFRYLHVKPVTRGKPKRQEVLSIGNVRSRPLTQENMVRVRVEEIDVGPLRPIVRREQVVRYGHPFWALGMAVAIPDICRSWDRVTVCCVCFKSKHAELWLPEKGNASLY